MDDEDNRDRYCRNDSMGMMYIRHVYFTRHIIWYDCLLGMYSYGRC